MMRDHLSPNGCLIVYSHIAKLDGLQQTRESPQDRVAKKSPLVGMEEIAYAVPGIAHRHYLQLMPKAAWTEQQAHETLSHE